MGRPCKSSSSLISNDIAMYGADATVWLQRWDDGKTVWSITMGGFGPGYEQCIQITAAETLRWLLASGVDIEANAAWTEQATADVAALPVISRLRLSGAQLGAAFNLAAMLYRIGPRGVMADDWAKDRHIQVYRDFPQGR